VSGSKPDDKLLERFDEAEKLLREAAEQMKHYRRTLTRDDAEALIVAAVSNLRRAIQRIQGSQDGPDPFTGPIRDP
jgi:hypothetical protein